MNNFFQFTKNFVPTEVCDEIIRTFEASTKTNINNDLKPKFSQVTLSPENSRLILPFIQPLLDEYKNKFPYLPETSNMELFRVKKYEANTDDQFDWHVDSTNKESADRYLAILVYLNDITEGGETEFEEYVFVPTKGSVLIFPPFWMFPHKGCPVKGKSSKYIMSTYFRYNN